jgi:hypothetical protein
MPLYSITRAAGSQYTTTGALETRGNQDGIRFDGYDQHGYATSFVATLTTVCPTTNRLWDYSTPATPVAHYVWYPYSMSMAACGGGVYYPEFDGVITYRPGYTYFKLYNSAGTFLMGTTTNTLTVYSPNNVIIVNSDPLTGWYHTSAAIKATTQNFNNSRNTLTMTGNTTYLAGVANPSTSTSFWTILAKSTGQTGQNFYYDTTVTISGNMSTATVLSSNTAQMGFITYNNAPKQPTSVVFSTIIDGISVTCQSDETNSISTGSVGAVSRIRFFYSTTATGTYTYFGSDTSITRTLISGKTYEYTASITGGTTLNQGGKYYFKVALMNDVCIQYQSENPTTIPAGQQSAQPASPTQYGTGGFVTVYDGAAWNPAPIWVHNGTSWVQKNAAFAKSDGAGGWIYN